MKKRILSFLLALLLLAAFPACSSQEQENASQNPTADGENPAGQAEAEPEPDKFDYARQKYEEIAAADYDGADFGITSQAATGNSEKEIWVETLTGDVVNDAESLDQRTVQLLDRAHAGRRERHHPAGRDLGRRELQARVPEHGDGGFHGAGRVSHELQEPRQSEPHRGMVGPGDARHADRRQGLLHERRHQLSRQRRHLHPALQQAADRGHGPRRPV